MNTYTIRVGEQLRLRFRMDSVRADSPITIIDFDGHEITTPFQTADAKHSRMGAVKLLTDWCASEGRPILFDQEFAVLELEAPQRGPISPFFN